MHYPEQQVFTITSDMFEPFSKLFITTRDPAADFRRLVQEILREFVAPSGWWVWCVPSGGHVVTVYLQPLNWGLSRSIL